MSIQKRTSWQKFLDYIWLPLATIMTAIDLIQIGDNFWPTIIRWSEFFEYGIKILRDFRDFIFTSFDWINIELSTNQKDYILFGLFFTSAIRIWSYTINKFRKDLQVEIKNFSKVQLVIYYLFYAVSICIVIVAWPIILAAIIIGYVMIVLLYFLKLPIPADSKILIDFAIVFFRILLVVAILILINYFLNSIVASQ
jgi:hypothetical protein